MIAALFVETDGVYFVVQGVDPWDEARDARLYKGPWPVVAHPPCQRWGRFWHGSTRKPHQFKKGDDGGCFETALLAVRINGGVLEHPAGSSAWDHFGMIKPKRGAGWTEADAHGGRSCYVEQGHYGHDARKATWLYAVDIDFTAALNFTVGEQRIPEWMIERYGYEKARKIGVVAMVGGKDKQAKRNRTPEPFRDFLLSLAGNLNSEGKL